MCILDLNKVSLGTESMTNAFIRPQEVLMRVAQYSQPVREIEMLCDHRNQIIAPKKQITDLQTLHILPSSCNHTTFEQEIQQLKDKLNNAWKTTRMAETEEDLGGELDYMTEDARDASEVTWNLRMQIASDSNGSGPSLRVWVRVGTELHPDWRSGLSINPNCRFGYGSIDISLSV